MHAEIQSRYVCFRASPDLLRSAKDHARERGVTVSELVRTSLRVVVPGYFGAPAIGGAKAAGLHNPLAGMPPPPSGFRLDAR